MTKAVINQFSLQSLWRFGRPLAYDKVAVQRFAEQLVTDSQLFVDVKQTSVIGNDRLYDYEARVPLFGGVIDVSLNASLISANYARGTTQTLLFAAVEAFKKVIDAAPQVPMLPTELLFYAHAKFEDPNAASYFNRFVSAESGIISGGHILIAEGREFKGHMKLNMEPSQVITGGAFLGATAFTEERVDRNLIERMAKRLVQLAATIDMEFILPQ